MKEVFSLKGWLFQASTNTHAAKDDVKDRWNELLGFVPGESVPEVLWSENYLVISTAENLRLTFSADGLVVGCLLKKENQCTDPLHQFCLCPVPHELAVPLEVPFAELWRNNESNVEKFEATVDWTFTSGYKGCLSQGRVQDKGCLSQGRVQDASPWYDIIPQECWPPAILQIERPQNSGISIHPGDNDLLPINELSDTSNPILFFTEVPLCECDLSDCGAMEASVKLRVHENFFYVALVQMVRVDGLVERRRTTRYFHRFGERQILRQSESVDRRHKIRKDILEEGPGHQVIPEPVQTFSRMDILAFK